MENYKMVSLIPARGGSKRVPRKNIKMLAGKPMVAWTIEASLKSRYISRTFVSTEDKEVKEIALQYGAEVIDRPKKYSTDTVERRDYEGEGLIWNFKEALWDMKCQPDYLAFLYPTSPLRTSKMIDEAFELMIERKCTRIVTVYRMTPSVYDYYVIDKKGKATFILDYTEKELYLRAQRVDFHEPRYKGTSDIIIAKYRDFNGSTDINYADFTLYIMDRDDVVDVNTPYDFAKAEYLLEERIKVGGKIVY